MVPKSYHITFSGQTGPTVRKTGNSYSARFILTAITIRCGDLSETDWTVTDLTWVPMSLSTIIPAQRRNSVEKYYDEILDDCHR
jgi:hypothetical protein